MQTKALAFLIILATAASAADWDAHGQSSSAPRVGSPVRLFSYWTDAAAAGFGYAVLSTNESGAWGNLSGFYGSPFPLTVYERPITLDLPTPSSDYAVRVALNESNFNYSRARPDGGDIRFYAAPTPPAALTPTDTKYSYRMDYWKINASSGRLPATNGSEQLYYMKFNNDSAYGESDFLAYDYSGNGRNGSIGGATYVDARFGKGLSFTGGGRVDLASGISLGASDNFSLEFWIYQYSLPDNQEIIDRTDIYTKSVIDVFSGTTGTVCFRIRDSNENGLSQTCAVDNLTTGSWFHIVGVRDGSADKIHIYVNGALQSSAAETTSAGFTLTPRLGGHSSGAYGFNGTMDNVIMYNRSLSDAEILDHYTALSQGNDSVFWVKLPATGTANFVMRYGNSSLTSESSGSFTSSTNATVWPERALSIFDWLNASVAAGTRVGWNIWANDSSGNWNSTPQLAFTLGSPTSVQTDKASYSACGSVYYRVSVTDDTGSPIDADLSIAAYDPAGTSRYSTAVSTAGGAYQSSFALPSGPPLGAWLLKVFACSVLGQKEFYAGEGDGNVWKITAKGTKARYSAGEDAGFAVNVVDQRGVGIAGLWPGNLTATIDSSTPAGSVVDNGGGSYSVTRNTSALSTNAPHILTVRAWSGALNASASSGFYVVP